jgi:hypothetical protein
MKTIYDRFAQGKRPASLKVLLLIVIFFLLPLTFNLLATVSYAAETAISYEMLVPGNVSTPIPSSKLIGTGEWLARRATSALITVETNSINFCLDGSAATAAAGTNKCHEMAAGQSYVITGYTTIQNFRCIDRVAGSASSVKITVFFGGE